MTVITQHRTFFLKPCTIQTSKENPAILVQLCSLQCAVMFQKDPWSKALALNHGDAATGEEYLCGIVASVYCDSVGLLASELLTLYPLSEGRNC